MTRRPMLRRGFTLIEIAITLVIVAIIGAALTRLMTSQLRYFQRQGAQKAARSISRGTLNVLASDLRQIEATGGVSSATSTQLVVRVPYGFGVVCAASSISLLPVDSLVYAQAVFDGYAWKDTSQAGAYTYVESETAPVAGLTTTCTAAGVQITTLTNGRVVVLSPAVPAGATAGAPVFLYETVTYEFKASTSVPGQTALWRTVHDGNADELAVPFDTTARFRFYALDSDTSQIAVPSPVTDIRGIELQLDALSENRVSGRDAPETSKVRSSIFFRNRIN